MSQQDDDGYQDLSSLLSNPHLYASALAKQIKTTSTEVCADVVEQSDPGSLPTGEAGQFLAKNDSGENEFLNISQNHIEGLSEALSTLQSNIDESVVNLPIEIENVNGLQDALDNAGGATLPIEISDVNGLQDAINTIVPLPIEFTDVNGLQDEIDSIWSDINTLQSDLTDLQDGGGGGGTTNFADLTDLRVDLGGSFLEGGVAMYGVLDKNDPTLQYAAMTLNPGDLVGTLPSVGFQAYSRNTGQSAGFDVTIGEETWFNVTAQHFAINGVEQAAITYDQPLNTTDDVTFHQISSNTGIYAASFNGDGGGLFNLNVSKYLAQFNYDVASMGSDETELYPKAFDPDMIAVDGDKIDAKFAGIFRNSTSTKQLKIYFGEQIIFDSGALTISAASCWEAEVFIIRVNSTTVRCSTKLTTSGASLAASANYVELTGLNFSEVIALRLKGTSAGLGVDNYDIIAKLGSVELTPVI